MKHDLRRSPLAVLSTIKNFIKKHKVVSFFPPHHTFLNLILPLVKKKIVVVGEGYIIRELASKYDLLDPSFCVLGRPFGRGGLSFLGAVNHDELLFNLSLERCASSWDSLRVCFVEKGLFNKPLVSLKKNTSFVVDEKTSFEALLSFLKKNNYYQKKEVKKSCQFSVLGGVVSVFPAGAHSPFRASFLDKKTCAYYYD